MLLVTGTVSVYSVPFMLLVTGIVCVLSTLYATSHWYCMCIQYPLSY